MPALSRRNVLVLTAASAALAPFAALARAPEIFLEADGFFGKGWTHAIDGHDAVAYFSLGASNDPVKGSEEFSTGYKGANWLFSSQENLDAFIANPESYAPQYGGYCAWAMAHDKLAKGDPEFWTIYNGKLYLNFNKSIQKKWLGNIDEDITHADENWPGILDRN